MKKILLSLFILIVALALVFAMSSVAFAGGYTEPTTGNNPHGSYSDTGSKCKVCHAVHNARSGGQTLLRSTRADACVYCHITGGFSIKTPYGTTSTNYTDENDRNHDNDHNGYTSANLYAGCVSCHSVHGANTFGGASKILKNDPGKALGTVSTEIDFCRDCHNKSGDNTTSGGCMNVCHLQDDTTEANISSEYYLTTRDGTTHIMTTTLTGNYDTTVAWVTSETCRKCHKEGQPYASGDSFPHYTANAVQFLDDTYTQQGTNLDLVCMNCHTDTGNGASYTSGVGKTF